MFYSRSLEEAEGFTREVVQKGYGTVVAGGGDGTLARTVNLVQRYIREANQWRIERYRRYGDWQPLIRRPRFGYLRLGTGNGIELVTRSPSATTVDARIGNPATVVGTSAAP